MFVCACAESLIPVQFFATPWTVAFQAPLSIELSRIPGILEWVAIPFSKDLPEPGIQPWSPALPSEPPNKDLKIRILFLQKKKGGKRQSTSVINLL